MWFTPPLLKRGHWEPVAQVTMSRQLLSIYKDGNSATALGNVCSAQSPHIKKYILMFIFVNILQMDFCCSSPLKHQGKNWEAGFNVSFSQQWLIKQPMRISWDRILQSFSLLHSVTWPSLEQHRRPLSISQQAGSVVMALKPFHSLATWLCKYLT